jgi:hypothetical protein
MDYPYKRWRLMPSFKPVEVEIVRASEGYWKRGNPIDSKGKVYERSELFDSKADAIAFGRSQLANQQADIDKRQAKLDKKRAQLDKAEG